MRPFVATLMVQFLTFTLIAPAARAQSAGPAAITPIRHLVVIFQENVSFDHYFGTYPNAMNPEGEPSFTAMPGTPTVNGLTGALLTKQSQFHERQECLRRRESFPARPLPGRDLRSEP